MRELRRAASHDVGIVRPPDRRHRLGRDRVEPHGDLEDQPERPERPGKQLGQVVTRHVLDHLAAGLGDRAVRQRHGDSQHEVARRAISVAQRPGVAAGDHATNRGLLARPERRVEREHLTRRAHLLLEACDRHARLDDRREIALVVLDDPVQRRRRQLHVRVGSGRSPPKLRAAATHPQRDAFAPTGSHQCARLLLALWRFLAQLACPHGQNRSAMPAASSGCCRYSPGTSPQSRGVGITLPGFARPAGSNAQRSRVKASKSGSSNMRGM